METPTNIRKNPAPIETSIDAYDRKPTSLNSVSDALLFKSEVEDQLLIDRVNQSFDFYRAALREEVRMPGTNGQSHKPGYRRDVFYCHNEEQAPDLRRAILEFGKPESFWYEGPINHAVYTSKQNGYEHQVWLIFT